MRFHIGVTTKNAPSWWLFGSDNDLVAWAGRTFGSAAGAKSDAATFAYHAFASRYEIYGDAAGWRWRAWRDDSRVAVSGRTLPSALDAHRAAGAIRTMLLGLHPSRPESEGSAGARALAVNALFAPRRFIP